MEVALVANKAVTVVFHPEEEQTEVEVHLVEELSIGIALWSFETMGDLLREQKSWSRHWVAGVDELPGDHTTRSFSRVQPKGTSTHELSIPIASDSGIA
jgi:hypothetical protein